MDFHGHSQKLSDQLSPYARARGASWAQDFQWQNQECLVKLGWLVTLQSSQEDGGGGPFREQPLLSVPRELHHTSLAQEQQEQALLWHRFAQPTGMQERVSWHQMPQEARKDQQAGDLP